HSLQPATASPPCDLSPCLPSRPDRLSPRLLPPPSSPLFPYTTLFRSQLPELAVDHHDVRRPRAARVADEVGVFHPHTVRSAESRDRKSTRLNSSHGSISYAVFCLKKKKGRVQHRSP